MTAGVVLVDGKADSPLPGPGAPQPKSRRQRRRQRIMNCAAVGVVASLLLVIVMKVLLAIYPNLFGGVFRCGTMDMVLNNSFSIHGDSFMKNGVPFKYISGSIHYSRLPNGYWQDRLRKMRDAGLDALQTYVPWNFHQPRPGKSVWTDDRDLPRFLRLAQQEGLLVILRAGPYICAEWDFGGLPAWLLQKNASMVLRSSDKEYLKFTDAWMTELLTKIRPFLYQNGGPIIMVQLENEYGSYYTCDKKYISHLYDLGRRVLGPEIILFTTDGYGAGSLKCGAIDPRFFTTVDFGTGTANDPKAAFADLRKIRPTGPLVNSEYYVGWLDIWGGAHSHVAVDPIIKGLKALYQYNASINMYMFFGGTNFGYWNGAEDPPFRPQVTSYDYDAPLSESGDMTWKYQRLREVIHELKGIPLTNSSTATNSTVEPFGSLKMKPMCHFTSLLPKYPSSPTAGKALRSMESYGVFQGYAVYSAFVGLSAGTHKLVLPKVRDRAYVFTSDKLNKVVKYHGVIVRDGSTNNVTLSVSSTAADFLHVLVENGGHVNFGGHMFGDVKGIFGNVTLGARLLSRWHFFDLAAMRKPYNIYGCDVTSKPAQGMLYDTAGIVKFFHSSDTYLVPTSFKKGQLMLNTNNDGDFINVGRYWQTAGPQKALYIPKQMVRLGINVPVLFEVEGVSGACPGDCNITFQARPTLGRPHTVLARGRGRS